jgi:hypothetical protein
VSPTPIELPRASDPLSLRPLDEQIAREVAPMGLTLFDRAGGFVVTIAAPQSVPEPIDFRAGALLTRDGNVFPVFDPSRGEIARSRAFGLLPSTDLDAPGVAIGDVDISPTLEHVVERSFDNDGSYDLVLVDRSTGERTTVVEGQQSCQCDAWPAGRWSASGRYFVDVAVDRVVIVNAEERTAREIPPEWLDPEPGATTLDWSPTADELLLTGPVGVSLLEVASWNREPVTMVIGRARFSRDGSHISVVGGSIDQPQTVIFARENLEALLDEPGRVTALAVTSGSPLIALFAAPGCDGILLTAEGRRTLCFEDARRAALAPNGVVIALAYANPNPRDAQGAPITWQVETFELDSGNRATIHHGPTLTTSENGAEPFMLWSDDGGVLAIYWPWIFGV